MSIFATPGQTIYSSVDGAATGLVGTIGVRVLKDADGSTAVARTTAGISEQPANSGHYVAVIVAPSAMAEYSIVWDTGGGEFSSEDLQVADTAPRALEAGGAQTIFPSVDGAATGLVGTIGVRVLKDSDGSTAVARATAGITEQPTGTGRYVAAIVTPSTAGEYSVVWDTGGGSPTFASEDLIVSQILPVPGAGGVGERITLNPMVEDAENAPLELSDPDNGLILLEHSYPPPAADVAWAGSADTEGEGAAAHRYKNREVGYKVRVLEPSDAAGTNLVTNPSLEVDTTGWSNTNSTFFASQTAVLTRVTTQAYAGEASLQVVTTVASSGAATALSGTFLAGVTYVASLWAKGNAGGEVLTLYVGDTGGDYVSQAHTLTTSWVRYTVTWTPSANRTSVFLAPRFAAGVTVFLDAAQVQVGSSPYFDGDSAGCAWTGTRHASTSTRPATGGARFASILTDVEKYVDRVNREHAGAVRRVTPYGQPITFDVVAADLSTSSGREFIHGRRAELELKLTCRPYGRGVETTLSDHAETTLPYLSFVETGIDGDAPALARLVVDEDEAADQYWLVWGQQSRHYSSSANADLFYQAEGRTAQGGSAIAAGPSGASGSGSNVMRNTALASSYQSILSTQAISAGAHLSHVGTFRVFARVQTAAGNTGAVSVALEWAEGDFRRYTRNATVTSPVDSWDATWRLVDLGIVKPTKVVSGTQRWEGRVLAKSTVAGDDIDVDYLLLVPVTEGSGEVRALTTLQAPTAFSARDEFDQSAGALTGKTAPIGGTWAGAGDADDFTVETSGKTAQRTAVSDGQPRRYATVGSAMTALAVKVDYKTTHPAADSPYSTSALVARYVDTSNYVYAYISSGPALFVYKRIAGTDTELLSVAVARPGVSVFDSLALVISAGGAFAVYRGSPGALRFIGSGSDSALATGGTLASGTVGFFDHNGYSDAMTRNYDNFAAWVPVGDAAMFASQSLELRHDRVTREDSAGTLWVQPSSYEGDYLTLPPAGREKRSNRLIVKACRNDPVTGPDSAIDNISARLSYTRRWLNVPDA